MPAALVPVRGADLASWIAPNRVRERTQIRFSWSYRDAEQNERGRGAVHLAPPDSARIDFRGPLGMGSGAAVVVGDAIRWGDPEDQVAKLIPNYPLFWAMLGVVRMPGEGMTVTGSSNDVVTAWRYAGPDDTVDFVRSRGAKPSLAVRVHQQGKILGRVVTLLGPEGQPLRSRLDVVANPARLEITFDKTTHPARFDQDTWNAPHPQ